MAFGMDGEHEHETIHVARRLSRVVFRFDLCANRYFEERFDIDSGALGYISSYTSGLSFIVQVKKQSSSSRGQVGCPFQNDTITVRL